MGGDAAAAGRPGPVPGRRDRHRPTGARPYGCEAGSAMIKTQTCHTAACDVCGDEPENGDGFRLHFDNTGDALAQAESADWWTGTGGDDLTAVCPERDEAHLAKGRELITAFTGEDLEVFLGYWPELRDEEIAVAEYVLPTGTEENPAVAS